MASVLETRLEELRNEQEQLLQGGGAKAIERQHDKARLTARERIAQLLDEGSAWREIGLFAAWGMYEEWGGAVAAGVVCGLGKIQGRWTMIIANDATVKAGAFFPMTAKKVLRCQTIALENHLPLVYLVDSAGVFLPLQDEVFPDIDDFGRVFRHNAVASALGIPQITAIMGNCVAGGAYLPVMCDTILMTEGSGLYLAGPALVQAAIGQKVSSEELGGAHLHAAVSGTVDFREANDEDCCRRIRSLMSRLGPAPQGPFDRIAAREPQRPASNLLQVFPGDPQASYDVRDVLACILDAGAFDEYRAEYGQTLVCGYGRLGGFAVGVVANQKKMVKRTTAAGSKRIEFGGVIYPESADKAARFIMDCNQGRIPLLFFHDVNGFMVGKEMEAAGIIRAGAKMVNVVANSVVPKFSVVIGGSFGAGNYAMCGRAYDPRLLLAWPTARYAVMGGEQAANTLLDLRVRQLERGGRKLGTEEREELLASIRASYEAQTDPRYGAARLWTDAIIDPQETRAWLVAGLEAASLNPELAPFRTGVLQT